MKYYTLNAIMQSMTNPLIEEAKVTSITLLDFNDMEGQNYQINVKLTTVKGYKNKLVAILVNSTYLDEWEATDHTLTEYIEDLLNSQEQHLQTA